MDLTNQAPKTVDELRNAIWEYLGRVSMDQVDDILEFVHANQDLLNAWAEEYLV